MGSGNRKARMFRSLLHKYGYLAMKDYYCNVCGMDIKTINHFKKHKEINTRLHRLIEEKLQERDEPTEKLIPNHMIIISH